MFLVKRRKRGFFSFIRVKKAINNFMRGKLRALYIENPAKTGLNLPPLTLLLTVR